MHSYTSLFLSTLSVLAVGALLAAPVGAEMYKYRDPQTGRLVISNEPPPAGADVHLELGTGPTPRGVARETAPVPAAARVQSTAVAPATASVLTRRTQE